MPVREAVSFGDMLLKPGFLGRCSGDEKCFWGQQVCSPSNVLYSLGDTSMLGGSCLLPEMSFLSAGLLHSTHQEMLHSSSAVLPRQH